MSLETVVQKKRSVCGRPTPYLNSKRMSQRKPREEERESECNRAGRKRADAEPLSGLGFRV